MANNTPAARMPRQFYSPPHIPRATTHTPSSGRVHNPLAGAPDDSGQGDYIAPPIHVGGLIGLGLDPARDKEYEQRVNARDTARMQKVQAGVDAYQQALEKTGDPRAALAQVFHTDNEGHVHFSDPQTFSAIMQMHQAASQGQQGQGQFQSVDLGHGLVGVADPSGKYSVHTAHDAAVAGGKLQRGPGGQYGQYNPASNDFTPATVGGQQQQVPGKPPKALSRAELDQVNDLDTVMQGLATMQQTVGATGLLTGHLEKFVGQHTEFSPTQAAAYNRAYDQIAPALTRLNRVPGQSKMVAQLALDTLPKPGQAEAYNAGQAIPGLMQNMRQHVATLYQSWRAEGKDTEAVKDLAMTNDAGPARMGLLRGAMQKLQTGAGQLNEEEMGILQDEQLNNRLTYDQSVRVTRQRIARGMMDPAEFDKAVAAHPDLAQISDSERTAPQYIRQWNAPQAQQIPSGAAPIASPGAPPGRPMYPHGTQGADQRTDPMAAKLAGQSSPQAQLPAQIQEPQLQQALPAANAMSPAAPTAEAQPAANPLAPDAAEMQRQQQNQELLQQTQQLLQQTGMPGNPNVPTD